MANSFKKGGNCLAGREIVGEKFGGWIRPVSDRPNAEVLVKESRYASNAHPRLLDIIDIPFLEYAPRGHQTENHVIDASRPWEKVAELRWSTLLEIIEQPASLWINRDTAKSWAANDYVSDVDAAALRHSLLLIKPVNFSVNVEVRYDTRKKVCRAVFDFNGTHYNLKLTDPVATNTFAGSEYGTYPMRDVYVCVSLTEPWEKDKRCYKLVAAILSNPPL